MFFVYLQEGGSVMVSSYRYGGAELERLQQQRGEVTVGIRYNPDLSQGSFYEEPRIL